MLQAYAKPYLGVPEQLDLLRLRGMHIGDAALAGQCLARIGYYRLKSYWYPFRQTVVETSADGRPRQRVLEEYRPGAEFRFGVDLYVFDKRLRLILLDALERVEVAMRVALAHTIGARGAWAHHDIDQLDRRKASALNRQGRSLHEDWLNRANKSEQRSRADWVVDYRRTYGSPLPIWMAVELWDFGILSRLLEMAHPVDRAAIGRKFGVVNPELLVSWVKTQAYVRNLCAHHSRVWNNPLVNQPMIPKNGQMPRLKHIGTRPWMQQRVYGAAAVAQHFLNSINPTSAWKTRLRALWADFPQIPGISSEQAGFYPGWEQFPLWR